LIVVTHVGLENLKKIKIKELPSQVFENFLNQKIIRFKHLEKNKIPRTIGFGYFKNFKELSSFVKPKRTSKDLATF
jgi:hypothetical protein